jgi:hypothetical protein
MQEMKKYHTNANMTHRSDDNNLHHERISQRAGTFRKNQLLMRCFLPWTALVQLRRSDIIAFYMY